MTRRRAVRGLVRPMIGDVVCAVLGNLPKPPRRGVLRHLPSKPIFVKSCCQRRDFCLLPTSDDPNCQMKTREEKFENKKRVSIHTKHQTFKKSVVVVVVVVVVVSFCRARRAEQMTPSSSTR